MHFSAYHRSGSGLLGKVDFRGRECWLDELRFLALRARLSNHLYLSATNTMHWVAEKFGVHHGETGLALLREICAPRGVVRDRIHRGSGVTTDGGALAV